MVALFDVDHTVIDGDGRLKPGVRVMFRVLTALDVDIWLWSARGCDYAADIAHDLSLPAVEFATKPKKRPITRALAVRQLWQLPDVVVDDCPEDRILDVPYVRVW